MSKLTYISKVKLDTKVRWIAIKKIFGIERKKNIKKYIRKWWEMNFHKNGNRLEKNEKVSRRNTYTKK